MAERRRVADQHAEVVAAAGAGRARFGDRQRDVELQRRAAERAVIDRLVLKEGVGPATVVNVFLWSVPLMFTSSVMLKDLSLAMLPSAVPL